MNFNDRIKQDNVNGESCIKKFLEMYKPGDNLKKPDEELLNFGKNMLPKEIVNLWVEYGFGNYGNGIIKVVDPRDYMQSLYSWLGKQDFNKIPIMMTAFGDILYYRKLSENENDISLLDIHYRRIDVCTYSYQDFFDSFIIDKKIKKELLKEDLYEQAINELGKLDYKEIFFFVPALILGGLEEIKYIQKGTADVHHQVLLQLGN